MVDKVNLEAAGDEELTEDEMNDLEENQEFEDDGDELEEGNAADTLKPGAGSGGTESKAVTLATFTSLLSKLGKEDLSNFFNDSQAVFAKNKVPGGVDKAAANRGTVNMKPSAAVGSGAWKEDIDDMFSDEELTEEMREKTETIFEAAVNTRMSLETVRLEEEFEAKEAELEEAFEVALEEETTKMFEGLSSKLDQYLDYVVEQWMEENEVAIESGIRTEIAENFMTGLHNLFSENYLTVPEEKLDFVADMKAELEEMRESMNNVIDEKLELEAIIIEATKEATLEEVSDGLAETQIEKLRTFAEGIEYVDADTYRKKLDIVKENYFKAGKTKADTGLITEAIDGFDSTEEPGRGVEPQMDHYVKAIKKAVK